jgi:hypothetical protein
MATIEISQKTSRDIVVSDSDAITGKTIALKGSRTKVTDTSVISYDLRIEIDGQASGYVNLKLSSAEAASNSVSILSVISSALANIEAAAE